MVSKMGELTGSVVVIVVEPYCLTKRLEEFRYNSGFFDFTYTL